MAHFYFGGTHLLLSELYANCLTYNQLVMKSKKLSVLFVIKQSKQNKRGLCPINFRLTYNKKRNEFSTGQFVAPKYWNAKKQLVSPKDPNNEFINAQLALITQKLNNTYLSLQLKESEFTVSDIMDIYFGRTVKKEENVYSYYKSFLLGLVHPKFSKNS